MKELIPLAGKYMEGMAGQPEKIKRFFEVKQLFQLTWVPLEVMRSTYQSLVNSKEIIPIEQLPKDEKERLWKIINSWVQGSREYKIMCVKVLHFIEILQDKKIENING
jgi:hypothetical protein